MDFSQLDLKKAALKRKNSKDFFCPLCRSSRSFRYSHKLKPINYVQIVLTTAFLSAVLWPIMGARSLFSFFFIWIACELTIRALHKKEISCPHCGFDASWYKKDVKRTRELVADFWAVKKKENEPKQHIDSTLEDIAVNEPASVENIYL